MADQQHNISVIVSAKDAATKPLKDVKDSLNGLDKTLGSTAWRLGRMKSSLGDVYAGFGQTDSSAKGISSSFSTLTNNISNVTNNFTRNASASSRVSNKFDRNAAASAGVSASYAELAAQTEAVTLKNIILGNIIADVAVSLGKTLLGAVGNLVSAFSPLTKETMLMAGSFQELEIAALAVGRQVGLTEREIRSGITALELGGIRTDVAAKSVAQFARFQIDLASATELATAAQGAAIIMGEDSSDTLEKMTQAIASGRTQMIRRMGITRGFTEMEADFAEAIGATVDQLTRQERMQARVNGVIEESAALQDVYEAAMESPTKLLRSFTGRILPMMKTSISEVFLPAMYQGVRGIVDFTESFTELVSQGGALRPVLVNIGAAANILAEQFRAGMGRIEESLIRLPQTINERVVGGLQRLSQVFGFSLQGLLRTSYETWDGLEAGAARGAQGMNQTISANFSEIVIRAGSWGANVVGSFAEGFARAASTVLSAVLGQFAAIIRWFLAPGSPPNLLPDLPQWGMGAMESYLRGFTMADFNILTGMRRTFSNAFRALVNAGELGEVTGKELEIGINKALIEAVDAFSKTGQVSEEIFDRIASATGDFGGALSELARRYFNVGEAMNAVNEAQERLEAAQRRQSKVTGEVAQQWDSYAQMLAEGAGEADLAAQRERINLAEKDARRVKHEVRQAEIAKKQAEDRLGTEQDRLRLQDQLVQQLVAMKQDQGDLAGILERLAKEVGGVGSAVGRELNKALKGTGGALEEIEDSLADIMKGDWDIVSRVDEEIREATANLKGLLSRMWREVFEESFAPHLDNIRDIWYDSGIIQNWNMVWDTLKGAAIQFWGWLTNDFWPQVQSSWERGIQRIGEAITGGETGLGFIENMRAQVLPALRNLIETITSALGFEFEFGEGLGIDWAGIGSAITRGFTGAVEGALTLVATIIERLPGAIAKVIEFVDKLLGLAIEGEWRKIGTAIGEAFMGVAGGIIETISGAIQNLIGEFDLDEMFEGIFGERAWGIIKKLLPFIAAFVLGMFALKVILGALAAPLFNLLMGFDRFATVFLYTMVKVNALVRIFGYLGKILFSLIKLPFALAKSLYILIAGAGGASGAATGLALGLMKVFAVIFIVIGAIQDIVRHIDYYREKLFEGIESIREFWTNIMESTGAMEDFRRIIEDIGTVLGVVAGILMLVGAALMRVFINVFPPLVKIVILAFTGIVGVIRGSFDMVIGLVKMFGGLFLGIFKNDWSLLESGARQFFGSFVKMFTSVFGTIAGIVVLFGEVLVAVILGLLEGIRDYWAKFFGEDILEGTIEGTIAVRDTIAEFAITVVEWFGWLGNLIVERLRAGWENSVEGARIFVQNFISPIVWLVKELVKIATTLGEFLIKIFVFIGETILETIRALGRGLKALWQDPIEFMKLAIFDLVGVVLPVIDFLAEGATQIIARLASDAKVLWGRFVTDTKQVIGALVLDIIAFFTGLKDRVIERIEETVGTVLGLFSGLKKLLVGNSIIPDLVNETTGEFGRMTSEVSDVFEMADLHGAASKYFGGAERAIADVKGPVDQRTNEITRDIGHTFETLDLYPLTFDVFGGAERAIADVKGPLDQRAMETGESSMFSFGEGVESFDLKGVFSDVFDDTGKYISRRGTRDFEDYGEEVGLAFGEGIFDTERALKRDMSNFCEDLAEHMAEEFIDNFEDHERDFRNLGRFLLEAVVDGFERALRRASRDIQRAIESIADDARRARSGFESLGRHLMSGLESGVNARRTSLRNTVNSAVSSALTGVLSHVSWQLNSIGQGIMDGIASSITTGGIDTTISTALMTALTIVRNRLADRRSDIGGRANSIGWEITASIISGLEGSRQNLTGAMVDYITRALNDAIGAMMSSPIPEAYYHGVVIVDSLVAGILAGKTKVVNAMKETLRAAGLAGSGSATISARYAGHSTAGGSGGRSEYRVLAPIILEGAQYKNANGEYNWREIAEAIAGGV